MEKPGPATHAPHGTGSQPAPLQDDAPEPARGSRRRSRPRLALQILLLGSIVGALLFWVDLRGVWAAIVEMPPPLLVAALAIATADRFLMGLKWRQLIEAGGGRVRLLTAVSAYYQSAFSGRILPIGVGQDVLRGYLVARAGVPSGLVLGSMAVEKLIAVLANVLLALLGVIVLASRLPGEARGAVLLAAALAAALAVAGLALAFYGGTHRLGGRLMRGRALAETVPARLRGALRRASQALLAFRGRPAALAVNLTLAVAEQFLQLLKFYVLGRALGVTMPFVAFVATIAVVLFARRATAYVEGWGLAEATSIVLFTLLGLERNTAVALALANYAVMMIATLPGGYLLLRGGTAGSEADEAMRRAPSP